MTTLSHTAAIESRRGKALTLLPAIGVHLSNYNREHCEIVDNRVVADRFHCEEDFAFDFVTVDASVPPREGRPRQQMQIDPYRQGLVISNPHFIIDYKLRLPAPVSRSGLSPVRNQGQSATQELPPEDDQEEPSRRSLRLARCYLNWDAFHAIPDCAGDSTRRPVCEFHMVFVEDEPVVNDLFPDVAAVCTYMIFPGGAKRLPLLDLLFTNGQGGGPERYLRPLVDVRNRANSFDVQLSMELGQSGRQASQSRREASQTRLEASRKMDSINSSPTGSSTRSSQTTCEGAAFEKLRWLMNPREDCHARYAPPRNPFSHMRTRSGNRPRTYSYEEANLEMPRLAKWDVELMPESNLYELARHRSTFIHYVHELEIEGAPPKPLNWFVAERFTTQGQLDDMVHPRATSRRLPVTPARNVSLAFFNLLSY